MSGKRDSARAALGRVQHLHPAQQEDILRELDRESLLDNPARNGAVRAAAAASALPGRECLTAMEVISANEDNAVKVRRVMPKLSGSASRSGQTRRSTPSSSTKLCAARM
jgi:hypothetical protein